MTLESIVWPFIPICHTPRIIFLVSAFKLTYVLKDVEGNESDFVKMPSFFLGQISPSLTSSQHVISLLYTDPNSHLVTQTLTSFEVPLMTKKWNRFALKVIPSSFTSLEPCLILFWTHKNFQYIFPGGRRQHHALLKLQISQFSNGNAKPKRTGLWHGFNSLHWASWSYYQRKFSSKV